MKILITGGLGYLGCVLTEELVKKGFNVIIVDKMLYGNNLVGSSIEFDYVKIIKADVRNAEKYISFLKSSDYVIHLAAIVGDPACDFLKEEAIDINLNATKIITQLCKRHKKPLVFSSTCSVYGASKTNVELEEPSDVLPLSIYALSKYAAEEFIKNNLKRFIIFRIGTLFGYSPRMRFDLVVNKFVADGLLKKSIVIFGGKQYRPFLHVRDATNFFIKVIEKNEFPGEIFNIGGSNCSISEVGEKIKSLTNCEIKVFEEIQDPRNYIVNSSKAINFFQLNFIYDIEYGAREIISKIVDNTIKDPINPKYSNLETLKIMNKVT